RAGRASRAPPPGSSRATRRVFERRPAGRPGCMAYRLSLDDLAASVKRVAREQLGGGADGLEDPQDPVEAVHDARKRLKKTRALLRLARPAMRPDAFQARNRELRDQGRALSGARDADALVETVDALAAHNTRRVKRAHFMAVRGRFVAGAA